MAQSAERAPLVGQFVVIDGRRSHVLIRGSGRPIVLLHGNGSFGEEILSAFAEVAGVRWIAPDRPGFGFSEPLPHGYQDPLSQAEWLGRLLSALGLSSAVIVAHSLASGLAVAFAVSRGAQIDQLVLLSPFCRPTPERLMLGLRLASAPIVGPVIRRLFIPSIVRLMRRRILRKIMSPNLPPPWVVDLPLGHAATPVAVTATAAELKDFNAGMREIEGRLLLRMPVTAVHGLSDRTADPAWHLPWLAQRTVDFNYTLIRNCGHAVHHAAPGIVLKTVLAAAASAGRG